MKSRRVKISRKKEMLIFVKLKSELNKFAKLICIIDLWDQGKSYSNHFLFAS